MELCYEALCKYVYIYICIHMYLCMFKCMYTYMYMMSMFRHIIYICNIHTCICIYK